MIKILSLSLASVAMLSASIVTFSPTPGTGPAVNVAVTVTDIAGGVRINAAVSGPVIGDLRGLFWKLSGSSIPAGLNCAQITGAQKTDCQVSEGAVHDLGGGANMNGVFTTFDAGVEIGTSGLGSDDIQNTTLIINNAGITASMFTTLGARLTSVGRIGRGEDDREESSKLLDTTATVAGGDVPEPGTLATVGGALLVLALRKRRA